MSVFDVTLFIRAICTDFHNYKGWSEKSIRLVGIDTPENSREIENLGDHRERLGKKKENSCTEDDFLTLLHE